MFNREKMGSTAKDSMTVQHIAQALEQKSTTTAHLQQRLQSLAPIQSQGSSANSAVGSVSPQSGSNDKKTS
jgi:hypothetical protein